MYKQNQYLRGIFFQEINCETVIFLKVFAIRIYCPFIYIVNNIYTKNID